MANKALSLAWGKFLFFCRTLLHVSLKVDKPAGSLARTNTELVTFMSSRELVFILACSTAFET